MTNDDWLKGFAAIWVVLMAVVAATISPVLCAAVVVGAAAALVNQARQRR